MSPAASKTAKAKPKAAAKASIVMLADSNGKAKPVNLAEAKSETKSAPKTKAAQQTRRTQSLMGVALQSLCGRRYLLSAHAFCDCSTVFAKRREKKRLLDLDERVVLEDCDGL